MYRPEKNNKLKEEINKYNVLDRYQEEAARIERNTKKAALKKDNNTSLTKEALKKQFDHILSQLSDKKCISTPDCRLPNLTPMILHKLILRKTPLIPEEIRVVLKHIFTEIDNDLSIHLSANGGNKKIKGD